MLKKDPLKTKRIFVGFNSAGAAGIWSYTRVLRRRGYQIDFYGINQSKFGMEVDELLTFSPNKFLAFFERLFYFSQILSRYEIWHLNFMEAFFFYPLNLLILKLFGKRIVCTFRGSEIRPSLQEKKWANFKKKLRMMVFCLLSDKIVLTGPFLAPFVFRYDKIIPYARDSKKLAKLIGKNHRQQKIVVLHAPTAPEIKGSAYILRAFRRLGKLYPRVEFRLLQGLDHRQLLLEISRCDIVIDQLLVGWYGGIAAEAMAMGKTVMAFINPAFLALVDYNKILPIYNTNIWQIEADLEYLINSSEERLRRGRAGIKFARKIHDSAKIAHQYRDIYRSTI